MMTTPDFIHPALAFPVALLLVLAWVWLELRPRPTYISWDCRDGRHISCLLDGGCTGCQHCNTGSKPTP